MQEEEEDELGLSVGLGETARSKSKATFNLAAPTGDSDFEPPPRYELQSTRIVDQAISELGALDIVVHCAGQFDVVDTDQVAALDRQWAINVRAPFAFTAWR